MSEEQSRKPSLRFDDTDRPPDHVGENGVKWWIDRSSTQWARRELQDGKAYLPTAVAWLVEDKDGHRTRILTEGNEYLVEDQDLTAFAVKIDQILIARSYDARDQAAGVSSELEEPDHAQNLNKIFGKRKR